MFKNHVKTAFRNLVKSKKFTLIHILGLAVGMTAFLIIGLFIRSELSFDRYNTKADQIVRVVFRGHVEGEWMKEANVMPPVARVLKTDFPEVLQTTRLVDAGFPVTRYGDKMFNDDRAAFVDPDFFQAFTLPLIEGSAATALTQSNTVVITRAMARKFFGNQDPMGKVLDFTGGDSAFRVTGVSDKVPENSHFHFDFFLTKEIGIRKVVGAKVRDIIGLLSADFLKLVVLSIGISCPVAWWGMHSWLRGFAYPTRISWWLFPAAGLGALALAWITVCIQALRAATSTPAGSLRTE